MLIVAALGFAAGGQAWAADLPQAAPPPPRAPATYVPTTAPIYNWSGFYIGLNAGGAFASQGVPVDSVATSPADPSFAPGTVIPGGTSFKNTGFLGGGQIGANFQASQFVFGVEGDIDYMSNKSTIVNTGTIPIGPLAGTVNSSQHIYTMPIFSTVRGRIGFAADRVLFYGTGGLAMGEYEVQRTQVSGQAGNAISSTAAENYSDLRLGWTAGAGVEVALADNWTARLEYLYTDLEKLTYTFAVSGRTQAVPMQAINVVRAGVNFKFGP
jgi:outer membrane immunogenic protein